MARDDFPPLMKKKSFIRTGEGSITSYNWDDMMDGTGTLVFYPIINRDSGGAKYVLNKNPFRPRTTDRYHSVSGSSAGELVTLFTLDFTTSTIVYPTIVGGILQIQIPYSFYGYGHNMVLNVSLRSGTLGELATITTQTIAVSDGTAAQKNIFCMGMTVPSTRITIGDTLTLRIVCTGIKTGGANAFGATLFFSHANDNVPLTINLGGGNFEGGISPSTEAGLVTTSKIGIPFKIDI
jgi:hypothetical protein